MADWELVIKERPLYLLPLLPYPLQLDAALIGSPDWVRPGLHNPPQSKVDSRKADLRAIHKCESRLCPSFQLKLICLITYTALFLHVHFKNIEANSPVYYWRINLVVYFFEINFVEGNFQEGSPWPTHFINDKCVLNVQAVPLSVPAATQAHYSLGNARSKK